MPIEIKFAFAAIAILALLGFLYWTYEPHLRNIRWALHWKRFLKRHIVDDDPETEHRTSGLNYPLQPLDTEPKDAYIIRTPKHRKGKHGKDKGRKKNPHSRSR